MRIASRCALPLIVIVSAAAAAACIQSDSASPACPDGWDQVTEYRLYFGRSDAGEILKEQTRVLTLLVWPDDTALQGLNEITAEYEARFNQESVLLTSTPSCSSFS